MNRYGLAIVTLVTAALVALACGREPGQRATVAGEPVETATEIAEVIDVPATLKLTGSVEPWRRVSPGTKILGRVEAVPVREGERVGRGQLLVRLEQRDLDAAVRQAAAAVSMAEANLDNAAAQHRRIGELHSRGSVTDKNLEDATSARRVAEAALEQARANLAAAEVALGYAEISSPIAGWVTARHVEAGDMAAPGVPLLVLEDLSRVKVVARAPESSIGGLEVGQSASVGIDVLDRSWEARIERIIPSGDPASRTFEVELVLDNPAGRIKSGMFARAVIESGTKTAVQLPATALVRRGQLSGVFVVESDEVARLRWVRPGATDGSRVEILSGLEPGERYVVEPPSGLSDGTPVRSR